MPGEARGLLGPWVRARKRLKHSKIFSLPLREAVIMRAGPQAGSCHCQRKPHRQTAGDAAFMPNRRDKAMPSVGAAQTAYPCSIPPCAKRRAT
jgi:hypothetical protein